MPLPELVPFPADAPKPGTVYRHYKGHDCLVVNVAYHTETGEHVVVYVESSSRTWFTRPLTMWHQEISPGVRRFTKLY